MLTRPNRAADALALADIVLPSVAALTAATLSAAMCGKD